MSIVRKKYKFDRTIGQNLFGRKKSPIFKRNYKAGQHGNSKIKRKISEYGEKVLEAKKIKIFYGGLRYKDLKRIIEDSIKEKGNSVNNIVKILESRLSMVLYRAKLASTIFFARQLINHGHVKVNNKKVDIGSYRVKPGDKITLDKELMQNSHVAASVTNTEREIPSYLDVSGNEVVFSEANFDNTTYPFQIKFIRLIEYFNQ